MHSLLNGMMTVFPGKETVLHEQIPAIQSSFQPSTLTMPLQWNSCKFATLSSMAPLLRMFCAPLLAY